ncbi:GTP cyclohydrolase I [Cynara cardunculus var. scolymus]|uniref:GTP cyclohydrolase 1 n=1 Tax=Cynara cardunculus var. scolymus TaxID=59895 RepID=A0A103Y774_CYNCS|nr:GTP cyclohydrolase I [Cynara cardunculus var. scolymus]
MGALDEGHYNVVLENGVKLGGLEQEPETIAIVDAVKLLLQGLGEDINREGLRKTPLRVAKAFQIVQDALFPEVGVEHGKGQAGGAGGLVLVRDLNLFSFCESCLLPFQVKCHVGYIPSGQRVVGLSKLSRVADIFAKRLQDPQRLADEICFALEHGIEPTGVAVVLECSHVHFPNFEHVFLDSNHERWVKVVVGSGSGSFEKDDSASWLDFFGLLRCKDVSLDNIHARTTVQDSWCPSQSHSRLGLGPNSTMTSAVASIIQSLGQDPCRIELTATPNRYVNWLMNFKDSNLEMKLNGFSSIPLKTTVGRINYKEHVRSENNLSLWSLCEHHLLPFYGVVHIGYILGEEVNSISKTLLQSIVHFHGFKLQVQERLSRQIAETVSPLLGGDVMVVVEADHTCMIARGIEKCGSNTATIAVLGRFSDDPAARSQFLQTIPSYCL